MRILSDKQSFIIDVDFLKKFSKNEFELKSNIYYVENLETDSFEELFQKHTLHFGILLSKNDNSNELIVSESRIAGILFILKKII